MNFRNAGLLAACLSLGIFVSNALAHPPSIERRLEKMTEKLGLNEGQVSQLRTVFESVKAKCSGFEQREERRACRQDNRESVKAELATILTPEQLELHKEMRKERRMRKRGRAKRREIPSLLSDSATNRFRCSVGQGAGTARRARRPLAKAIHRVEFVDSGSQIDR